ncbi:Zn2/Cys6 DNA-binding protein [Glarea lozoyensis ATCC 20868]|uniref:Zn2/Cys6 DNA-binding protein n=1 Tax=Glarea lozoyensis (strain ATCC 20868 / MF5171) TaxID=1116229 RepID=S3ECF0_GLAL2|nr:Zn2/Cys6 DNA-binding protein [Glarea lozoyensis ATCC 20868]EPE35988.1 Zn2/Cys6 DNA-binding protein [Glarea lozoyensis ATCC 20868]
MSSRSTSPLYNPCSVINNINLNDTKSLREFMVAFNAYINQSFLDTVTSDKSIIPLHAAHAQTFRRIIRSIKDYSPTHRLLLDAMTKFAAAANGSKADIKRATMGLVNLADSNALERPMHHPEEYMAALEKFESESGGCKCEDGDVFDSDEKKEGEDDVEMQEVVSSNTRSTRKVREVQDSEDENTETECSENEMSKRFQKDELLVRIHTGRRSPMSLQPKKKPRLRTHKNKIEKVPKEKLRRACLTCYTSHVMCDRVMPVCGACHKNGKDCQWEHTGEVSPYWVAVNIK